MTKREIMTTKTDQELTKLLADTRTALRVERFSAAGARAKDPNSPRKLRATIARALTEQHARGTSAATSVSSGSRPATA
ncbi:MAG: large ribosomal subunit protein uL29 [Minisyncoccota bacterium]